MMELSKKPFEKFTEHAKHVLERARDRARREHAPSVTPAHLVSALLKEKGSLAYNLLKLNEIRSVPHAQTRAAPARPPLPVVKVGTLFDETAKNVVKKAASIAAFYGSSYVGTEHLLFGITQYSDIFKGQKRYAKMVRQLEHLLASTAQLTNFKEGQGTAIVYAHPLPYRRAMKKTNTEEQEQLVVQKKFPALSFFCEDLTHKAKTGSLPPFFGREREVRKVIATLLRKSKNNPLLVGEAGVGKTALVHGMAHKIAQGTIVPELASKRIFSLDVGLLVAGTVFRGEFEARLKDVIEEAKDEEVILFIDEIHTIVGAGSAAGSLDLANMLKAPLTQGELRVIAATTPEEYKKTIEKDTALSRRFHPIAVREESEESTLTLLRSLKPTYEEHHQIAIAGDTLPAVISFAQRYQPAKRLPDKALDLLDEAASRLKLTSLPHTHNVRRELEHKLKEAQAQKQLAVYIADYEKGVRLKGQEEALRVQLDVLKTNTSIPPISPVILEPHHIKETMEDMLGVKLTVHTKKPSDIAQKLAHHIVGQNEAVAAIAEVITRAQAGLTAQNRPLASFLFLGPSGVGKTETARELARIMFGETSGYVKSYTNFIRLDMSEFSEPHSISRLIGAPPGYVGYEEGGFLTTKIKNNPYALVLFDELEKAHPQVFNILLSILDEGMLTSAESEHVSFKNTIIILTSNIGTEEFNKKAIGFTKSPKRNRANIAQDYRAIRHSVLSTLKETLRPELLNRLDQIITFMPLDKTALTQIVKRQCAMLGERLKKEQDITIEIEEKVYDFLASRSESEHEGARLCAKVIAHHVEFPIASHIVSGNATRGDTLRVKQSGNQLLVVTS